MDILVLLYRFIAKKEPDNKTDIVELICPFINMDIGFGQIGLVVRSFGYVWSFGYIGIDISRPIK
jgi:hypothetical protein